MADKKRVLWLDLLKILACFLVIVNHTHRMLFSFAGESPSTVLFDSLLFFICKGAVPLFVMTSGYFLLPRENTYQSVLKRAFYIAVPLVLVSVYHYITTLGASGNIRNFIGLFLKNPQSVELWYLYMLLGLYMATPFLSKMIRHFSAKDYAVFIALFLLLPSVVDFFELCSGYYISDFFFNAFFPGVLAYYIAGIFLTMIPRSKKILLAAILLYAAAILAGTLSIYLPYRNSGELYYYIDSWYALPIVLSVLTSFYIIRYFFEGRTWKPRSEAMIRKVSEVTFGIYLSHCMVKDSIYASAPMQAIFSFNPYLGTLVQPLACFLLCGMVIYFVRKLPILKKFL